MFSEPIAVTLLVIDALDRLKVPYFIGGSLASTVHGLVRTTQDADLVAELRPENETIINIPSIRSSNDQRPTSH